MHLVLLLLVTLAYVGCGAEPPPPVATPSSAPVVASAARRGPSDVVRQHWVFDEHAELTLYADVAGFAHTALGQALVPMLLGVATASLKPDQARCVSDIVHGVQEVLVGSYDGGRAMLLMRVDDHAFNLAGCMAAASARPTTIEGSAEAYQLRDGVVAHVPGLVVMGTDAGVVRAMAQTTPRPTPAAVTLGDGEYLAWTLSTPSATDVKSASGRLVAGSEQFRLDVEAELSEKDAIDLEQQVQAVKAMTSFPGVGASETPLIQSLLSTVSLNRDGKHISAAMTLEEPVDGQLRDLTKLVELGVYGVRKYITSAKIAEARAITRQISKDLVSSWARDEASTPTEAKRPKAPKKTKLVSFPAVPKEIPRGVKYQSTQDDWKPWSPIAFSIEAPQYFQYEVVAAKDGQSASILARGDLNGDGKSSTFKLAVSVDPKDHSLHVAPALEESDPEE